MWRQGLPVPCRREVYFCGKMLTKFGIFPRGSPECAGSGENPFLLGQPVFADLFGAAATFCREVAVFDPTFAVGRRIAGRKFPLRAVSAFSDKRLCSYLCRAAVGRRIDGRRCFPQFMEKEIWFYITISSWSAAVMPAAVHIDFVNRLRVQSEPRRHGVKTREDRFFITSHSIFSFRYQFFFMQSVQNLGSPFQRLGPFRLCTSRRSKSIRRRSTSTPATCASSGVPRRITSPEALPSRRQSSLL